MGKVIIYVNGTTEEIDEELIYVPEFEEEKKKEVMDAEEYFELKAFVEGW